jgi:hypothetical protein
MIYEIISTTLLRTYTLRLIMKPRSWLSCQSEPAPTSEPTRMDGALIGFSFPSLWRPRLTFVVCPFSALISVCFLQLYFLPTPHPVFFLLKLFPPTPLLTPTVPIWPTRLYIFKLKVVSSPSTYSPINLKCATFISTYLPSPPSIYLLTCPSTFLPTNTLQSSNSI